MRPEGALQALLSYSVHTIETKRPQSLCSDSISQRKNPPPRQGRRV